MNQNSSPLPSYLRGTAFAEIWDAAYPLISQQPAAPVSGTPTKLSQHAFPALASTSAPAAVALSPIVTGIPLPGQAMQDTLSLTPAGGYSAAVAVQQSTFSPAGYSPFSAGQGYSSPIHLSADKARHSHHQHMSPVGNSAFGIPAGTAAVTSSREPPPKLPMTWNTKDKCMLLELARDGTRVKYIGMGKNDSDAASVRSNHPIPPQCGLFYYEIEIIEKGRDGYIGIGLCTQSVALNRLPGWEPNSWGYHGDDGHSFCCSGSGKPYGPTFTTGDVIGCCVNFLDRSVFYTKNGVNLGVAFRDLPLPADGLKSALYASVGMRTPGEIVEVNFGRKPFHFAIDQYMQEQKRMLWEQIMARKLPRDSLSKPNKEVTAPKAPKPLKASSGLYAVMNSLIRSYLVNHGYCETAETFAEEVGKDDRARVDRAEDAAMTEAKDSLHSDTTDKDIRIRQRIRDAILSGDMDTAIALTQQHYPDVFKEQGMILFRLRCRKFVEMMLVASAARHTSNYPTLDDDEVDLVSDDDLDDLNDDTDDAMIDVDGVEVSQPPASKGVTTKQPRRHGSRFALKEAMLYGQKLQEWYRHDASSEVKDALVETFSLLAYPDPAHSAVAHLLDTSGREQIAYALNGAVLVSQGLPPVPPLEMVYRQTKTAIQELTRAGVGAASFINVKDSMA